LNVHKEEHQAYALKYVRKQNEIILYIMLESSKRSKGKSYMHTVGSTVNRLWQLEQVLG
jgi:hypothetical protein